MRVCTASQMKEADRFTIEDLGVAGTELMFHAATAVYEQILKDVAPLEGKRLVILAGSGNNGGDGYALAQLAAEAGMAVLVIRIDRRELTPDADYYASQLSDVPIWFFEEAEDACLKAVAGADVIVDAMYGTGFRGVLSGNAATCAQAANQSKGYRVAVDLPSGVICDTGKVEADAFCADVTVTFTAKKPCHFLFPAADYCGKVVVADIGVPDGAMADADMREITADAVARVLPQRPSNSHKGTFGRLLCYCGSEEMTGAAVLCVGAALQSGVGLVEFAGTDAAISAVGSRYAEPIYTRIAALPDVSREGDTKLLACALRANAVVCGPGVSLAVGQERRVLSLLRQTACPMVHDADGITLLSRNINVLSDDHAPMVLTPHPLEMARLTGLSVEEVQANRPEIARQFAKQYAVTLVLKGANTLVASPDGRVWFNHASTSGLAKGGSGDVLAGVIGSLLAQGVDPMGAAIAGVYIHSRAGMLGAEKYTEYCLMPSQLFEFFPTVFKQIKENN